MALTNEFIQAVQSDNLIRVRIMLKDSLLIDPTATQFSEMEHYALSKMEHLYTDHDGETLNFDTNSWNETYLNQQMVAVVTCFSKERIALLKRMVQYLYKDKIQKTQTQTASAPSRHSTQPRQIGIGLTGAGAVLAVAGVCTSHTLVTVGGVVIAVAGISSIIRGKGGN